MFKQKNP